ncbi:MAG: hypothetical protein IH889_00170 [Planctomycetes bacterium]|nr:hypothetical protein [Planctomycetota bacterium]
MSEFTGVSSSSGMIPLQGGGLVEAVDEAPNLILDESISLKPNCSVLSVPLPGKNAAEHDDDRDDEEDLELDEEDEDFDEDDLLDEDDEEDDDEEEVLLEDEEFEDDESE